MNEGNTETDMPWRELMAFGFGVLKLSPSDFWSMTLLEMDAAIHARSKRGGPHMVPDHKFIDDLMQMHPDNEKESPV